MKTYFFKSMNVGKFRDMSINAIWKKHVKDRAVIVTRRKLKGAYKDAPNDISWAADEWLNRHVLHDYHEKFLEKEATITPEEQAAAARRMVRAHDKLDAVKTRTEKLRAELKKSVAEQKILHAVKVVADRECLLVTGWNGPLEAGVDTWDLSYAKDTIFYTRRVAVT